ncbi:DMT family transporter [Arenimonas sp. MALMAid1274]|uniref:DMT family transporter n=1 Tax=Arenimonas sp. MALMAid1274 TaxID=3411630 RepID=UPI003BA226A8
MSLGLGELFSLLSALAWAVGVILYRQLGATLPPLQLNFLKNGLVLLMLLPAIPLLHGLAIPRFSAAHIALALASGAIGIGIADTLYFRALNALGAGRMGVLGNFYSPFVIVLGYLFLDERLTALQLWGFVLVSVGVFVAAWPKASPGGRPPQVLRGLGLALLSIALMAVAIVMVKRVLEAQPLLWVTGLRMVGALGGMVLVAALTRQIALLHPPTAGLPWRRLALAAFVGQFLAMILWLAGYKYTQASVAAILNETASVFILLLAAFWLKEPLTRRGITGVALTLSGVAFMLVH